MEDADEEIVLKCFDFNDADFSLPDEELFPFGIEMLMRLI
jgi:hypothetical protein